MWQDRLAELQADIALSPKVLDGMPYSRTNATGNPTQEKAIKLAEVAKVIEGKISEIQITLMDIERFITGLSDSEMRLIIEQRCIRCQTWDAIGDLLGYDRTTVAKKYSVFLDEHFPIVAVVS